MSNVRVPELNTYLCSGRLCRDFELRYTKSSTAVANGSIAINRRRKNFQGEWENVPLFLDVRVWGKTAEFAGGRLRKGDPAIFEGNLEEDSWTDRSTGEVRKKIIFVAQKVSPLQWDDPSDSQTAHSAPRTSQERPKYQERQTSPPRGRDEPRDAYKDAEDDLPF